MPVELMSDAVGNHHAIGEDAGTPDRKVENPRPSGRGVINLFPVYLGKLGISGVVAAFAVIALGLGVPRATGNREVRSASGGPGGCIARRRRKAPWSWAPTDDNAARRRPVVAGRTALLPVALRSRDQGKAAADR